MDEGKVAGIIADVALIRDEQRAALLTSLGIEPPVDTPSNSAEQEEGTPASPSPAVSTTAANFAFRRYEKLLQTFTEKADSLGFKAWMVAIQPLIDDASVDEKSKVSLILQKLGPVVYKRVLTAGYASLDTAKVILTALAADYGEVKDRDSLLASFFLLDRSDKEPLMAFLQHIRKKAAKMVAIDVTFDVPVAIVGQLKRGILGGRANPYITTLALDQPKTIVELVAHAREFEASLKLNQRKNVAKAVE